MNNGWRHRIHTTTAAAIVMENERQGTRLPLRVPVAFRASAGHPWSLAWTVNVSRSGILLEGGPEISMFEPLDFVIGLSSGIPGSYNVQCRGHVVRVERAPAGSRVAVTIDDFECLAASVGL